MNCCALSFKFYACQFHFGIFLFFFPNVCILLWPIFANDFCAKCATSTLHHDDHDVDDDDDNDVDDDDGDETWRQNGAAVHYVWYW